MNHGEHGEHGAIQESGRALVECPASLSSRVLDAAFAVHRELGPGLLEAVYEAALMVELANAGIPARNQVPLHVVYRGVDLGLGYRADIVVADCLLLEIKAVEELTDVHMAQVMTYLRLLGYKRGYLLNFNRKLLREGIKRVSI